MNKRHSFISYAKPSLKRASGFVRLVVILAQITALATACALPQVKQPAASSSVLSVQDDAFLEDLSHRAFLYFWEQSNPQTGLALDRSKTDGTPTDEAHRTIGSIASTGFGLTALCIAAERQWVEPAKARERVATTLRFFAERATNVHGWFYHWMDVETGERRWQSEVSSIDTALLLGGVLAARGYYQNDDEIKRLATTIYERVDFTWMLAGHPTLLSHGWKPETGFLESRWGNYSEETVLYLLAIGSPTHAIKPDAWYAWHRDRMKFKGYEYIASVGPLFIHQFSHAWVDYRGRRDRKPSKIDYFENSVTATRAQRRFCMNLAKEFPGYSENIWGITASDSAKGYVAWGGPPRDPAIDGTVVPCAAGGSLMFTPDICLPALQAMKQKFGDRIYGKYGFADAFNPNTGWVDTDVIGIDQGITLLSAENLRSGNVWLWFMRNTEIPNAMDLVGLQAIKSAGASVR